MIKPIIPKSARLQPSLVLILLVITIISFALYTGALPGRKPLITWQTEESLAGTTGRAVTGMGEVDGMRVGT